MRYGRYRSYDDDDYGYGGWPPYVPVAERRRKAAAKIASLKKKGQQVSPVILRGRAIVSTFWGKAWCQNLEGYSDYSNRLPRGRTYVRNGSVIDLQVTEGKIGALVQGSSLYKVEISIRAVETSRWESLVQECSGKIDSLIELLQGKFSTSVMAMMTNPKLGLFPAPKEIKLKCSCPDWATVCKHVAATLYGVGARLDEKPDLLFCLRKVNHLDLLVHSVSGATLKKKAVSGGVKQLAATNLSELFGIDLDSGDSLNKKKVSAMHASTPQPEKSRKQERKHKRSKRLASRSRTIKTRSNCRR